MKPNLFVAIPAYGSMPYEFLRSLMAFEVEHTMDASIRLLPGDSLVSRARNTLTAEFLKTDCTHLLFIDSDLVFDAKQVQRLLDHDLDVVGGCYPKKQQGPLEWVCNIRPGVETPTSDGLQEVRYIGTGFMMVKRAVFERMMAAHPEIAYRPDPRPTETEWDFWAVGPYQDAQGFRRYLSEDWYFCQRWLDLGGKVFADTRVILKHVGQAVYPLKTQMAELGTAAVDLPA